MKWKIMFLHCCIVGLKDSLLHNLNTDCPGTFYCSLCAYLIFPNQSYWLKSRQTWKLFLNNISQICHVYTLFALDFGMRAGFSNDNWIFKETSMMDTTKILLIDFLAMMTWILNLFKNFETVGHQIYHFGAWKEELMKICSEKRNRNLEYE